MKTIPLTQGKFAIVDDEDFDRLNQHKWYAMRKEHAYYVARKHAGKKVYIHHEIIEVPKGMYADHINGNGLDNRKCNLRACTGTQNNANATMRKGGTSKYKGVSFNRAKKRWQVQISFNYKRTNLGYFDEEVDAAMAYDAKAVELFGEFAKPNFPRHAGRLLRKC